MPDDYPPDPPSSVCPPSGAGGLALPSLVFLIAATVYTLTMWPSVGHGHDTGELTVAAATLGIPHPPGYPLYTRLGWLWCQLLPGTNAAWKMNLFSALGVAWAGACLAYLGARVTGDRLAGWVAGLLFCFAQSPWYQALAAEVFGLHLAMLASLAVVAQSWPRPSLRARRTCFCLAAALFGLGAAHHHTLALAAPGLILFAWMHERRGRRWGWTWWMLPIFGLCSLPFYLDMMFRAQSSPFQNWGDPRDLSSLLHHFLRRAYGTFSLAASSGPEGSGEAHAIAYCVSLLRRQFPVPLIALAGFALWFPAPRLRPITVLALVWAFSYGPLFSWLGQQAPDEFHLDMQERFFASSYFAVALLCGLGAFHLSQRYPFPWVRGILLLCPFLSLGLNLPACNRAGQYQAYDTVRAMFDQCPPGAVLVVAGDLPSGVSDYLQSVEGYRTDLITVFPGLIGAEWYQRRLPQPMRQVLAPGLHKEVLGRLARWHLEHGGTVFANQPLEIGGVSVQRGLAWQWYPDTASRPGPAQELQLQRQALSVLRRSPLRGERRLDLHGDYWTNYFLQTWSLAYRDLARKLFRRDPQAALWALDAKLEISRPRPLDYVNRGLLEVELKRLPQAEQDYQMALSLEPHYIYAAAAMVDLMRSQGRDDECRYWEEKVRSLRKNVPQSSNSPAQTPAETRTPQKKEEGE